MLIPIALAGTVVAAAPTVATPWFEADDYPAQAFDRRWEGTTVFELTINAAGVPVACRTERSSGYESLDRRACAIAQRRARFEPARTSSGQATFGAYRGQVRWARDPALFAQSEFGPDLEVSLNRMPAGVTGPVSVKFAVEVDASGAPIGCAPIASPHADALGTIGCAKIRQDFRRSLDPKAGNLSGVQTAWITFNDGTGNQVR